MHALLSSRLWHRGTPAALVLALLVLVWAPSARAQPSPPSPSGERPVRLLLIGDSFLVSGLGPALERLLVEGEGVSVVRRGKTSSGLARPDFHDWWEQGRRRVEEHQPDVVVLMMGGNDGQDLLGAGLKRRVRWRTEEWPDTYKRRMLSLMETLGAPGRRLVWVELPMMEPGHLERKVQLIRQVQREAIALVSSASYVQTHPLRTAEGALLREVPGVHLRSPIREPDGIHLTQAGGHYLAQQLVPLLREHLVRARTTALLPTSAPLAGGANR
jgi:hypothetical protein